jgi:GT2 family glycosyltransferase
MQKHNDCPLISVIIVNFNGMRFLEPCLSSLTTQSFKNFEIILVDNHSSDGSAEYIREYFSSVTLIETGKNLGFAGGTNTGIRASHGDFILTLNTDTITDPHLIENLVRPMESDSRLGMCASKMLFPDGRINSTGICISRSGAAWDRGIFEQDSGQFDTEQEVFGPCAGAALYRRAMLDEIGLFDEDFFIFMEDVDLAFRARLAGWKCIYIPTARVIHLMGGTAGINTDLTVFYGNRNLLWNAIKNFPTWTLLKSFPWIIGRNCVDIPYYLSKGKGRVILKAKASAFAGITRMIRKRKSITRKIPEEQIRKWIHVWMKSHRPG